MKPHPMKGQLAVGKNPMKVFEYIFSHGPKTTWQIGDAFGCFEEPPKIAYSTIRRAIQDLNQTSRITKVGNRMDGKWNILWPVKKGDIVNKIIEEAEAEYNKEHGEDA